MASEMLNEVEDMEDEESNDILQMYAQTGQAPLAPKLKIEARRKLTPSRLLNNSGTGSPHLQRAPGFSPIIHSQTSETYGKRSKSGDVVFRYMCKDSSAWEDLERSSRKRNGFLSVKLLEPSKNFTQKNFKFMFQKVSQVAYSWDEHISQLGQVITEHLKTGSEAHLYKEMDVHGCLVDSNVTGEALYVGRIVSDGRLTEDSVLFEGSLDDSDGHLVTLDLAKLEECSLFPGQVVVVQGVCEGKYLRVAKIHTPPPLPLRNVAQNDLPTKLNVMIAAGPFTPKDSLQFEPLKDFIGKVRETLPDVCVMVGPLLEASHELVVGGQLDSSFADLVQGQIDYIEEQLAECPVKLLLVASHKDLLACPVYPTPPFTVKSSKVTVVPDPSVISVHGILIATTSLDVLMHMSRCEFSKTSFTGDRLGRLAQHLLSQRNLYPLHPPVNVPLDVKGWRRGCGISGQPHILILPSELRHFIKNLDGTLVVNPERLVKGSSGGIYVRLQLDLSALPHSPINSVADVCVGEILKI